MQQQDQGDGAVEQAARQTECLQWHPLLGTRASGRQTARSPVPALLSRSSARAHQACAHELIV